ncbi:phage tail protein [Mucilaginibacter jinjuensis]|uniref:Tail fiber protein n=1 Tax=Mucilaginibacter jinjuensis TaxID=1176721 RepID=A0ABY7T632_9SPHI|nr:tail fiber protein [Mucilaginibacter jinjuensis]WCT11939.1 tail fiber protein [Mucilaginibacter jinjuensis]
MDTLGEIRVFGGNYAPNNYVICDGRLLQISQYQGLYALLGTLYGGNGSTTFGVPDLRGRVMVNGFNATGYPVAQPGGSETVVLTQADIPTHSHSFNVAIGAATVNVATGNFIGAPSDPGTGQQDLMYLPNNASDTTQELVALNDTAISNNMGYTGGASTAHENRQPFMGLTYMICVIGLYPDFN